MASTTRITLAACLASGCFAPVGNEVDTSTGAGTGAGTGTGTGTDTGTATSTDTSPDTGTGTDTPTTGEPSQCAWKGLGISGPSARAEHSMVYDSDAEQILLFGGIANGAELDDLWKFDGQQWQEVKDATNPPPPVRSHAAAYDPMRKVMVVFGGVTGQNEMLTPMADTYLYDPAMNTWAKQAPMPAPTARFGASMAYHNGNILLFGGNVAAIQTDNEHWSWDGLTWTALGSSNNMFPKNRSRHMVAMDPSGNLLLYGGCQHGSVCLNDPEIIYSDAWTWDGAQWQSLLENAGGGQLGAMALHITENKLYRFSETDRYTWDGATWSPPQPTDMVSGVNFAVAYHPIGLIRFGGNQLDPNTWVLECPP